MASAGTIVVGAGWSGLAAAAELCLAGRPVTIVEAARRPGGRAAGIERDGLAVEIGQHLLIGAYRETLGLLARIGVDVDRSFARQRLEWRVLDRERDLVLGMAGLPAPFHVLGGVLRAEGLDRGERLACLRLLALMVRRTPGDDETVADLLGRGRQPPSLVRRLWGPLCLAVMATPPESASARVFCRVMRDTFARRRSDSDLLIPRRPLAEAVTGPIVRYITSHGGRILSGRRVRRLVVEPGRRTGADRIAGVELGDGEVLASTAVVLALPPTALCRLLPGTAGRRLASIPHEPITTVYLEYPGGVGLPTPMIALTGGHAQWLLDRGCSGQPGLIAAVISGPGPHLRLDRDQLATEVAGEVAVHFPDWPRPRRHLVLRERRATLSCTPAVQRLRPGIDTSGIAGCLIAGDSAWRAYPSTLEGAVRSGLACARRLTDKSGPGGYHRRP